MNFPEDSKLPGVGTTIFTIMSQLAQQTGAINLSQGYPDFNPPARLLDLLSHYIREGFNQYPPMTGVPKLREEIANKVQRLYGAAVDVDSEITVTSGATEALLLRYRLWSPGMKRSSCSTRPTIRTNPRWRSPGGVRSMSRCYRERLAWTSSESARRLPQRPA